MTIYEAKISAELRAWQRKMIRKPGVFDHLSKRLQDKVNSWIPEKIHNGITTTIKQMIRGMLFGAEKTTRTKPLLETLEEMDAAAAEKIDTYRKTAAAEGAVTGAGGIFLGLADFPILLGIKLKLLFEIASIYNRPLDDYRERLYMLHIFQLAFSSARHRRRIFTAMENWEEKSKSLPADIHQFDWRNFQQEYRDYIDIAKMAQLLPIVGAPVGAIVNYRLIKKLGYTAIRAYHLRLLQPAEPGRLK